MTHYASNQFPKPIRTPKGRAPKPNSMFDLVYKQGEKVEYILINKGRGLCQQEKVKRDREARYKAGRLEIVGHI